MALAEALDVCFANVYIPHVHDLIYRYVFNLRNAGGIPYDSYLRITQELTVITADEDNRQEYTINGVFHRLDGPARITNDDTKIYYRNGKVHRLDGPAMIWPGGCSYYVNGKLHRLDGPALIRTDGYQLYSFKDMTHRVGGPAVIYPDGETRYCRYGKLHREDGPAIIYPNGNEEYWIKGVRIYVVENPKKVRNENVRKNR